MMNWGKVNLNDLREHSLANRDKLKAYETIIEKWQDVERNYALMQLNETVLTTMVQITHQGSS